MRKNHSNFSVSPRLFSTPVLMSYLVIITALVFSPLLMNYFVADDFTWLHWAAECPGSCHSVLQIFLSYFLQSGDFFYRPGVKMYFFVLYHLFGTMVLPYHLVSLFIHIICSILVFLLAKKILQQSFIAFLIALSFSLLASHAETIMWVSSICHLLASLFILLSLYLFMLWKETKKRWLFITSVIASFLAPLFHEYGVIAPVLVIAFDIVWYGGSMRRWKEKLFYLWYILASVVYFFLKIISHSFWSAGDYRYDLPKLPFNVIGNSLGDIAIGLFGNPVFVVYNSLRGSLRTHLLIAGIIVVVCLIVVFLIYKLIVHRWKEKTVKIFLVSLVFLLVPLLPFLGLGNTAMRYVYVSSFGAILLVTLIFQLVFTSLNIPQTWRKATVMVVLVVFFVYQVVQLQVSYLDWRSAGQITHAFVTNMQQLKERNIVAGSIYVAQVPYTYGQAWIFPAGLQDSVWLASDRHLVRVMSVPSESAGKSIAQTTKLPVYVFEPDGKVATLR